MMKTHTRKKNSITKRNNNLMVLEWSCSSNRSKENEEKSVSNNMYHAICVVGFFFFAVRLSTGRHSFSDVTTNSLDCHFTNAYILFFWLLDIYVNWIISEPLNICVTAFFFFCIYNGVQSILQWFYRTRSVFVYVGFFPNHPHRPITKCIANATSC